MTLGLHHVTGASSIPLALRHGHRIPAGSDETNKRYSAQLPMGGVRNLVDCRQKTKAAAPSYYGSRIDKRGLGEEVDFNASFYESPQKQRIGSCHTPGLF